MNFKIFLKPLAMASVLSVITPVMAQEVDLTTAEGKAGYAIGVNIGLNLQSQGLSEDVDVDAFLQGIADALGGELQMSEQEIVASIQEFSAMQQAKAQQAVEAQAQASSQFLADNALKPGVTTTASGLQYEVLSESSDPDAAMPGVNDTVNVHYHGTLVDGSVFDSSVERGEPVSFPLSGVIAGWTEGLQLMKVGDKFRFFIPSELGYGANGAGPIPANATLIFDVELLGIQ